MVIFLLTRQLHWRGKTLLSDKICEDLLCVDGPMQHSKTFKALNTRYIPWLSQIYVTVWIQKRKGLELVLPVNFIPLISPASLNFLTFPLIQMKYMITLRLFMGRGIHPSLALHPSSKFWSNSMYYIKMIGWWYLLIL